MFKYKAINHIKDSFQQPGEKDVYNDSNILLNQLIVIEEKVDGTNIGIQFINDNLTLQSRCKNIPLKRAEDSFNLLRVWSQGAQDLFREVLTDRFILFGEWCQFKHSLFYDCLPDYFIPIDIYDKQEQFFVNSDYRYNLLSKLESIIHLPRILATYVVESEEDCHRHKKYLGASAYCNSLYSNRLKALEEVAADKFSQSLLSATDLTGLMEGLILRVEEGIQCKNKLKFVRAGFKQCKVSDSAIINRLI